MKNQDLAYELAVYLTVALSREVMNIHQLKIKAQELLALLQNAEGENI